MSDDPNLKLIGFIEYLSLISDMMNRMRDISENYGINPSKLQEDETLEDMFADADPMIIGLLVKTVMKFRKLLDKPMENIDQLDSASLIEFNKVVKELKEKVLKEDDE